jgi:hypothetical protein
MLDFCFGDGANGLIIMNYGFLHVFYPSLTFKIIINMLGKMVLEMGITCCQVKYSLVTTERSLFMTAFS